MIKNIRFICSVLLLCFTTNISSGQITFEKGYLIDNENIKIECLIKNIDRQRNPKDFVYKLDEYGNAKTGTIETVKEFGIYSRFRFIRANVKIDRSPEETNLLVTDRKPIWSQEQLFLKILIEGTASLYGYHEEMFSRFFYAINDSLPQQLVYKRYLTKSNSIIDNTEVLIGTNAEFRQQIWNYVKCGNTTLNSLKSLDYTQTELEHYFKKFNLCSGDTNVDTKSQVKSDIIHLRFTTGIDYSQLSIRSSSNSPSVDLGSKINFRFGLDVEYILSYNRNKWGIIFAPSFHKYESEKNLGFQDLTVNYRIINFPIGVRHYIFITNQTNAYINAFYISNFFVNLNSSVLLNDHSFEPTASATFAFGAGVAAGRLNAEIRYQIKQNIVWALGSEYNNLSIIVGFKLF
jgi:hypothetical protein